MLVKNCKQGTVIETIHFGMPSGNIYRISMEAESKTYVYVWKAFNQGKTLILGNQECRTLDENEVEMMGYKF